MEAAAEAYPPFFAETFGVRVELADPAEKERVFRSAAEQGELAAWAWLAGSRGPPRSDLRR